VSRLARAALRAYPPSFRERYGAELAALVEDLRPSTAGTVNLWLGAARAWVRPPLAASARPRLEASISVVWIAWCAACLLAPAVSKALLDQPTGPVDPVARHLLLGASIAWGLGCVLAVAGAGLLTWRVLVPAVRARRWQALRPLLPALVLGPVVVLALAALVASAEPTAAGSTTLVLGSIWSAGLVAFLAVAGAGPAVTLRRLHPDAGVLRVPALLAVGLAGLLALMTVASTLAVVAAGGAALLDSRAVVVGVLAVGVLASTAAVVSAARAVPAALARSR